MRINIRLLFASLLILGYCPTSFAQVKAAQNNGQEVAVLQAHLKMMEAYEASLLSTVYWSLGVIITITILLVTYNWFVNNKMSERDRAALNQELRNVIDENTSQNHKDLEENINSRFAHIEKEHEESIKNTLEKYISPLSSKIDSINRQLPEIYYKLLLSEAWYWELQTVEENELNRYIELLPLAVRTKSDHNIA